MQYRNLIIAAALVLPALAGAGDTGSASDTDTDIRVACIIDFVTSELDGDRHDTYIDACVQEKLAKLKATAGNSKG